MTDFEKILIKRDGLSELEARKEFEYLRDSIFDSNFDYDDIEDMLLCEYGLEADYLMDFLF